MRWLRAGEKEVRARTKNAVPQREAQKEGMLGLEQQTLRWLARIRPLDRLTLCLQSIGGPMNTIFQADKNAVDSAEQRIPLSGSNFHSGDIVFVTLTFHPPAWSTGHGSRPGCPNTRVRLRAGCSFALARRKGRFFYYMY